MLLIYYYNSQLFSIIVGVGVLGGLRLAQALALAFEYVLDDCEVVILDFAFELLAL